MLYISNIFVKYLVVIKNIDNKIPECYYEYIFIIKEIFIDIVDWR